MKSLIVTNAANNVVIATNVTHADNFFARLGGLMFRGSLKSDAGLLLDPCYSIHTFFMRFTIAAIFLGEGDAVLKIVTAPPWRISIARGAKRVLELPASTPALNDVSVGDVLRFQRSA